VEKLSLKKFWLPCGELMAIFFIWQTICHHASNIDSWIFMAKFLKAISLGVTLTFDFYRFFNTLAN